MKMKIYLAGPINDCSIDEMTEWRDAMINAFPEHIFLNPVDFHFRPDEYAKHYKQIVKGDLRLIEMADVVVANLPRPSIGTSMEIWYAASIGVPVLLISNIQHPWLLYTATCVVEDLASAIMAIRHLPLDVSLMRGLLLGVNTTGE
jgi:nucleoside 2-deoxyribosyltransferase